MNVNASAKINKKMMIGLIITAVILIFVIVGLFYTPYDPNAMDAKSKLAAPSLRHIFGCDNFGRRN